VQDLVVRHQGVRAGEGWRVFVFFFFHPETVCRVFDARCVHHLRWALRLGSAKSDVGFGVGVWGLGFGVWGLGFGVWG